MRGHEQAVGRVLGGEDGVGQVRGPVFLAAEEQDAAQLERGERLERVLVEVAGILHGDGAEREEDRRLAARKEVLDLGRELRWRRGGSK